MGDLFKEFRAFLLRGNLLEIAVAFVIGAAFVAVVNALVADIIQPILAAIGGVSSLQNETFKINGAIFKWGDFVTQLITFVSVAAAVFFLIVKPAQIVLARLRTSGDEPATVPSEEVVLLTQIRDALANRT